MHAACKAHDQKKTGTAGLRAVCAETELMEEDGKEKSV